MKASINHCYGDSVVSQSYLDKFLKFTFCLPDEFSDNGYKKDKASVVHYLNLIQQSQTLEGTILDKNSDFNIIEHIIKIHNLSLREVETLVRHIEIYQLISNKEALNHEVEFGCRLLRLLGVTIFCFNSDLTKAILSNRADAKIFAKFLGEQKIAPLNDNKNYPQYHQVALAMLGQECHTNNDLFNPTEQVNRTRWDTIFQEYFPKRNYGYEKGNMMDIVIKTINSLSLSN